MTAARGCDSGSATVYVLALGLALGVAAALVAALGLAAVARHRAAVTADGAALAAAVAMGAGRPVCPAAASLVLAAGATLRGCIVRDGSVTVGVEVATRLPGDGSALAFARAGPTGLGDR